MSTIFVARYTSLIKNKGHFKDGVTGIKLSIRHYPYPRPQNIQYLHLHVVVGIL